MQNALISVIIPVYKVEKYLDRCVLSVVNQTYKNLEIILVDDGSPDNSPKMCDEWAKKDKRIKVIHKQNGGVSVARNDGLKMATGDYIAFVDSDDWIEPTMYEEMLNLAISENADLTFCGIQEVRSDGSIYKYNELSLEKLREKDLKYFLINARSGYDMLGVFGGICRILFKSSNAKNNKFDKNLKHGEDLCYLLKIFEVAERISVCKKCFYNYFKNEESVCNTINNTYFENATKLHKWLLNFIKERNLDYRYLLNHLHLYRNVINRAGRKSFVAEMKNLSKTDELLKECFNLKNYRKIQKLEIGFKQKVRNFLMYHKMWRLFKILANKK